MAEAQRKLLHLAGITLGIGGLLTATVVALVIVGTRGASLGEAELAAPTRLQPPAAVDPTLGDPVPTRPRRRTIRISPTD